MVLHVCPGPPLPGQPACPRHVGVPQGPPGGRQSAPGLWAPVRCVCAPDWVVSHPMCSSEGHLEIKCHRWYDPPWPAMTRLYDGLLGARNTCCDGPNESGGRRHACWAHSDRRAQPHNPFLTSNACHSGGRARGTTPLRVQADTNDSPCLGVHEWTATAPNGHPAARRRLGHVPGTGQPARLGGGGRWGRCHGP